MWTGLGTQFLAGAIMCAHYWLLPCTPLGAYQGPGICVVLEYSVCFSLGLARVRFPRMCAVHVFVILYPHVPMYDCCAHDHVFICVFVAHLGSAAVA